MDKDYLNVCFAYSLSGKKYWIYRFLETLPGLLAWATLLLVVFLSWLQPVWMAFFIIAFDIYWLLKVFYLSLHLRSSFRVMKKNMATDWLIALENDKLPWQKINHLVLLPFYKESVEVLSATFEALTRVHYPKEKMIIVLATEERVGESAKKIAEQIKEKYGEGFSRFLITTHPANVAGELAGKGSNIAYAARQAQKLVDELGINYDDVVVSAFDIDTQVYLHYFSRLAHAYLTDEKPTRASFQPVPIYNNNIWDAPFFSRVVAMSGTFWQMMQQERPERLASFSSHSLSFRALVDMDFWPVGNVSEDSRIFWKALMAFDGDYRTVPLYYPVSLDANLASNFLKTAINVYKQQRRWGWGVENVPYFLYGGFKNKKIPRSIYWRFSFNQFEGFWSWGTNALLIFLLGWLPLYLGGDQFNSTVLSKNLPFLTRTIMYLAMVGLVSSAVYSMMLLPPRPEKFRHWHSLIMILQWLFVPVAIVVFGSFPGLDSQTRLLFGKYMGFWVTEKAVKK